MPRQTTKSSPYHGAPTRSDAEGRVFYASPIELPYMEIAGEKLHVVTAVDEMRPDLISDKSLGDSNLWWAIMAHNDVKDPFTLLRGDNLRVPLFTLRSRATGVFSDPEQSDAVFDFAVPVPPKLVTVAKDPDSDVLHMFSFEVPHCATGRIHFEIQAAIDPGFRDVLLGKMSATSLDRWSTYKALGGFVPWPASGLYGSSSRELLCYFAFLKSDPLAVGGTYYVRYRSITDSKGVIKYGSWIGSVLEL